MKGVWTVEEINSEKIIVSKQQTHIEVINPKNYKIEVGSQVTIGFSKQFEGFQGFICLLIPILIVALSLFFYKDIARTFHFPITENFKFLCSIVLFLLSSAIIIRISHRSYTVITPKITSVA